MSLSRIVVPTLILALLSLRLKVHMYHHHMTVPEL